MKPAIGAELAGRAPLPALGCDVQVNSPADSEPQGRPIRRHPTPRADEEDDEEEGRGAAQKKKKGDEEKAELPPSVDCPSDLAVQPGPRTLDTREAPTNSPP